MTDQPDEHDAVRRLLADARADEPMPPEVTARMDDVLAELRREQTGSGTVTTLPAPHRRRTAGVLLVAAAAIVVGGVSVTAMLPHDRASDAGAAADRGENRSAAEGNSFSVPSAEAGGASPSRKTGSPADLRVPSGPVTLRPAHFAADVSRLRGSLDQTFQAQSNAPSDTRSNPASPAPEAAACVPGGPGAGRGVPAVYDHAPSLLVFRRPSGAAQVVDLYLCGTTEPVRSITLPVP